MTEKSDLALDLIRVVVERVVERVGPEVLDQIERLIAGEKAKRVEEIRGTEAGAPALLDALAELERGKPTE